MSSVYLSFLGLGTKKTDSDSGKYEETSYILDVVGGKPSRKTPFVQVAEMELLGAKQFDKLIIVVTKKSRDEQFDEMKKQLDEVGARNIIPVQVSEDMSPAGQWKWFEEILARIEHNDDLTVDITHGYRAIPIVFSTAINFLQRAKGVRLKAVYYGAFEKNRSCSPIIDMKEFFVVNEWAEAVSRLVEDADTRKLGRLAETTPDFQLGELNDDELIRALEALTDSIRNVDVNNVARQAQEALELIEKKRAGASETGRILLGLMIDKFSGLVIEPPESGKYDRPYFEMQLKIIGLLLEHKLYMQAYTVMREFVASVGMLGVQGARVVSKKGRSKRKRYAETFIGMLRYPEEEWRFEGEKEETKKQLIPYYERLKGMGLERELRGFFGELADYRDGFDHAWTAKDGARPDIAKKGQVFCTRLQSVFELLDEHRFFTRSGDPSGQGIK